MSAAPHEPWCTDHRFEMISENGECHGARVRHEDELGTQLELEAQRYGCDDPTAWIAVGSRNGEFLERFPLKALAALAAAARDYPEKLIGALISTQAAIEQAEAQNM